MLVSIAGGDEGVMKSGPYTLLHVLHECRVGREETLYGPDFSRPDFITP